MEKIRRHFRYFQDPHLVARFQFICGIRGTFFATDSSTFDSCGLAEQAHSSNNGALHHHTAGEAGGETSACVGVQRRITGMTEPSKLKHGMEDASSSGVSSSAGGKSLSVQGSTLKPLRRNSLTGEAGQEFVIEKRFLFYLFTFGTELGNESFYIVFFSFLMWNVDAFVSRRSIMVWVWVMYVGQCTKDVIGWPRPASPPVVKVEMFYNSEYSMPSTHAMSGTAIPFSSFFMTHGRWEDVIAGLSYSILILLFFLPALDMIDSFNSTCHYAPLVIVSIPSVSALFSFTSDTWSTSRGDTAQILGVGAGVASASHVNQILGLMPDSTPDRLPLTVPALNAGSVWAAMSRLVSGVMVSVAIRASMKAITFPSVCWVFSIPSLDVRKARQHVEVELPYRYIVYGTMGFSVLFSVPSLFTYLEQA